MAEAVTAIWSTIWRPSDAFRALAARPTWLLLAVLAAALNATFAVALAPYAQKAALAQLERTRPELASDPSGEDDIRRQVEVGQQVGMAASPVLTVAKWGVVAAFLWAVLVLAGHEPRFKSVFAIVAHANVPLLAGGAFGYAIIVLAGSTPSTASPTFA